MSILETPTNTQAHRRKRTFESPLPESLRPGTSTPASQPRPGRRAMSRGRLSSSKTANKRIYEDVCKVDDKISCGTVCRNLGRLTADGQLCHVRVPGTDRYDSRTDMHNHLNCMQCGTAVDAPLDYRTKIDTTVAGMTGRQINRHRIIVEGLCSKCQRECEKGWLTKK